MPTDRFSERRSRLATCAAADDVDFYLITNLTDVRYLTGFDSSNAALLVGESTTLVTDRRYLEAATKQCAELEVIESRDTAAGALRAASDQIKEGRLGFAPDQLTVAQWRRLSSVARERNLELIERENRIEQMRAVKDESEISSIRLACLISERALTRLMAEISPGMTERAIAARLHWLMCNEGAERPAFESIVAAGANSAEPHHSPGDRPVARGDLLKIDFGALYEGYHADMTRTFVVGVASDWQIEIHSIVEAAAAAGRAALEPSVDFADVDRAARQVIEVAGFGPFFGHGLGHGVGLDIHEAPMFSATSTGTLSENMTVTIEPGIYLPGRGGVRIEDSLVVSAQGAVSLTTMNRGLVALG